MGGGKQPEAPKLDRWHCSQPARLRDSSLCGCRGCANLRRRPAAGGHGSCCISDSSPLESDAHGAAKRSLASASAGLQQGSLLHCCLVGHRRAKAGTRGFDDIECEEWGTAPGPARLHTQARASERYTCTVFTLHLTAPKVPCGPVLSPLLSTTRASPGPWRSEACYCCSTE